jgi:hypothetical protein
VLKVKVAELSANEYLMSDLLSWDRTLFQVELKLLCEKALMQLLAAQGLLAEGEMSSPLLGLVSLHDQ